MADEENTLGGRVKRYAQVGRAVGGLAARMGAERVLGVKMDRGRDAVDLKAALGSLKGPLMKVAQILSTIPDALPEEYTLELAQLQANAPHMGWPFVKRRMAAELGPDWQARFASFEHDAASAASLGQVHRAVGKDGRLLACKLQYPDMASVVEADLGQLKAIFGLYAAYDRAIDTSNIHAEIAERLREELDYLRESRHMALYSRMLATQPQVHVPDVIPELTTKRLLTMSWLEGQRLLSVVGAPAEIRNQVAMNMFHAWYVPFYEYGIIHGDPHLGNYTIRPEDHAVNLLDFGCIRVFPPSLVKGVIDLYHALERDDHELAVQAYRTWGFKNLTKEAIAVLNLWAEFVYAPLMENRARSIDETNSGAYGHEIAAKVHRELKRIGGVTPPREFVLMDRAAIGLGSVFLHLKAEVNWHRLFHDLVMDFDVDVLAKRQAAALAAAGL